MVRSILILLLGMILILPSNSQDKQKKLKLWYRQPALQWDHGMPIGNGRLGAMIYGGVQSERIVLNEESIWSHDGEYTDSKGAYKYVKKIRQLLFDGKYKEAEKLAAEKVMGDRLPSGTNTYQELGYLTIDFPDHNNAKNYYRELDIETAIATVRYKIDETEYSRESFSSAVDQAIYWRITANDSGKINVKISLQRDGVNHDIQIVDNEIVIRGIAGKEKGVGYCGRVKVIPVKGKIFHGKKSITVSSANTLLLVITAATDYSGGDPFAQSKKQMEAALGRAYTEVRRDHIAEYQSWFNRFSINLGSSQAGYFPTDERLEALGIGAVDPSLISLYVQFSRYLLISSSRPGCLPANLQGIWVDGIKPPWNSDYHININLQMNYWLAEVTNLSECSYPLFNFIEKLIPNGRKTARTLYGSDGFTAHHTSDAWFFTTCFGYPKYGAWPMAGGWLCRHLWEHYLYTQDLTFLKNTAYPIMKEATEFYLDFLVEDPKTGLLVSGPSISPENSFITPNGERASLCMGPSMDHQIIQDHILSTVKASELLNADVTFRHKMLGTLDRLTPVKIGKDGRIMEWSRDFKEAEPGHRHMSHLYGLHPANLFTWQETPELMEAAKKVLGYRLKHGGGHTGWSRAWIINFYARLKDQEKAYSNVRALLSKSTLPSMLDTHPPFQIDGNFGGCSGIVEMLIQSHGGEIELLPALPLAWKDGEIKGVRARGGFEIDMKWDEGQLVSARIKSLAGKSCEVLYKGKRFVKETVKDEEFIITPEMLADYNAINKKRIQHNLINANFNSISENEKLTVNQKNPTMKKSAIFYLFGLLIVLAAFTSCVQGNGQKKNNLVLEKGTFGYDLNFLEKQGNMIVLSGNENKAQVIVSPRYQGKVFTSTAEGLEGKSFGWINYNLLESDTILDHMNAYGGEDRLWIGPEGGQFSIFFKPGGGMNIDNWFTPAPIDTESWELISKSQSKVEMQKEMTLKNYSGSEFNLRINRNINLFDAEKANDLLGIKIPGNVNWVGYGSENIMTNTGDNAWTRKTGTLSIWMLNMFSPGDHITVVIPFREGDEKDMGPIATTNYFGEITPERIKYSNHVIFFRVDGNKRRKLGLSQSRVKPVAGSYDAKNRVLTIVKYSVPEGDVDYVNQLWPWQENPFVGDVMNAYNDGPLEDGSQMGPFYEIESSSPAAFLEKGENITHHHQVFHFTGPEDQLDKLSVKILGVTIEEIKQAW